MTNINTTELINTCDRVAKVCIRIDDAFHSSSWLFDKLMRYFESNEACVSVTIPVFLNAPVMCRGEATIGRDGSLILKREVI